MMSDMQELEALRASIDNIDSAIFAMLAERFKLTDRVGHFKAKHQLAARDAQREAAQHEKVVMLAEQYGLDAEFARQLLDVVLTRVVENHRELAARVATPERAP
ncbi:MAG: chorismate mutase [Pseudomonadales bacterium]